MQPVVQPVASCIRSLTENICNHAVANKVVQSQTFERFSLRTKLSSYRLAADHYDTMDVKHQTVCVEKPNKHITHTVMLEGAIFRLHDQITIFHKSSEQTIMQTYVKTNAATKNTRPLRAVI